MSDETENSRTLSLRLSRFLFSRKEDSDFALAEYFVDRDKVLPAEDFDLIAVDLGQRWLAGQPLDAEAYLARFPELEVDQQRLLDLVYQEFLQRESQGLAPEVESFAERFPGIADPLRAQVAFHLALEAVSESQEAATDRRSGPADSTPAIQQKETVTSREWGPHPDLPDYANRYRPIRKIGSGGMADVWLAFDLQLERQIALKLPRQSSLADDRIQDRFPREARALASLCHPNISAVYDFGQHGDQQFMVMPYLSGRTLAEELADKGRPPLETTLALVARVACALDAAHRIGIAHRDIKPSNIMLNDEWQPTVMDFGLMVSPTLSHARLTSLDTIAGTPAYIAPERIIATETCDNFKADVYSLGVVLYEMLTGRLPYDATSAPQMLAHIVTESPLPPKTRQSDIPPEVDALCMRALAKSPLDRFSSMNEFADALRDPKWFANINPQDTAGGATDTASDQTRKARRRPHHPAWKIALVSILVVSALLTFVFWRPAPAPSLRINDVWSGTFQFENGGPHGDVILTIDAISGDQVAGTYRTEHGEFVWAVEGTIVGGSLSFDLTEAKSDSAKAVRVAGQAKLIGRIQNDLFSGEYRDQESVADIKLHRQTDR
ncbi:MAG: serine/threonine protein kinase [Planctomycetales bacterium]|nr:serine/threonine protein kinase [Planctomycetales bacterium]